MGLEYIYIYLHVVDCMVNVGKYTVRPMDPMGYTSQVLLKAETFATPSLPVAVSKRS